VTPSHIAILMGNLPFLRAVERVHAAAGEAERAHFLLCVQVTHDGLEPLHLAALAGRPPVVAYLLGLGATADATTWNSAFHAPQSSSSSLVDRAEDDEEEGAPRRPKRPRHHHHHPALNGGGGGGGVGRSQPQQQQQQQQQQQMRRNTNHSPYFVGPIDPYSTPLHLALTQALFLHQPHAPEIHKASPARSDYYAVAVALLEHEEGGGADPNRPNAHTGDAALHLFMRISEPAASVEALPGIRRLFACLLERGADPNGRRRNADGATPLHVAMSDRGAASAVLALLLLLQSPTKKVDPNLVDTVQGRTPLHLAARNPHTARFIPTLLRVGACPFKTDRMGYTPLQLAEMELDVTTRTRGVWPPRLVLRHQRLALAVERLQAAMGLVAPPSPTATATATATTTTTTTTTTVVDVYDIAKPSNTAAMPLLSPS
jgi:ankyrin repeat protein